MCNGNCAPCTACTPTYNGVGIPTIGVTVGMNYDEVLNIIAGYFENPLLLKKYEGTIPSWNMQVNSSLTVVIPSSITVGNIKSITAMIRADNGEVYKFNDIQRSSPGNLQLATLAGSVFVNVNFSSLLSDRGTFTIEYV